MEPEQVAASPEVRRASSREEIAPLLDLCRAGRLFDVQRWIDIGKPVNPPPRPPKGQRPKSPLEVTIESGFHSLVEVLLRGGAVQEPLNGYDSPVSRALRMRRLDMIELLIQHGCDPRSVNMLDVLRSWDPKIIDHFVSHGADVVDGQPFAHAFCERIQKALRPFKTLCETRPELVEQANIALRHHCKEGDMKWVSLLLWAGADPTKPGADEPGQTLCEGYDGLSALGYAALYQHYEVFDLKPVRIRLSDFEKIDFARYLHRGQGTEILCRLLEKGFPANDLESGGSSLIQNMLDHLSWSARFRSTSISWDFDLGQRKHDSEESRDTMKAIHLLAKHGGRWIPKDKSEVNSARRSLLQMTADYTVEFVWIMLKYKSCKLSAVKDLIATPTMKTHMATHRERLNQILSRWASE